MLKILFAAKDFFLSPEKATMEENDGTGRIYFLVKGQIVAVAVRQ